MQKTNAMRMLDKEKIEYQIYEYDSNLTNGELVAESLGENKAQVFKTLVTQANTKEYFVFVVPVSETLDLKKAAKAAGDKNIQLVPVKDLLGLTGYIRGGCSPVGMKKKYPTHFEESCILFDEIAVSAGERGHQMILSPALLSEYLEASINDLII